MNRRLWSVSLIICLAYAGAAAAQEQNPGVAANTDSQDALSEIIVTGTRLTGVRAQDSSAPIQVLAPEALQSVGRPSLTNALAVNAPSLQVQPGGSDLAGLIPEFRLRGLSPNDTLVLVDGKRRHTTASVSVASSPFQTGAGVDLNFIPLAAIDHVEILQEGASAQYGTDAIAGVVNIITKKADHGLDVTATGGEYMDGGGDRGAISANLGLAPLENSWLNLTAESRYQGHSYRIGVDPRVVGARADVYPTAQDNPDYPNVDVYAGDPLSRTDNAFANFGYDFGRTTFYGYASYGHMQAYSFEGFRAPNIAPSVYPDGFSPQENLAQNDYETTFGLKGEMFGGWTYDLSSTFGNNTDHIHTIGTVNQAILLAECAELRGSTCGVSTNGNTGAQTISPNGNFAVPGTPFYSGYASDLSSLALTNAQTSFYDGSFSNTDWTNTLDIGRDFNVGLASPLNLAYGAQLRRETYEIMPGEPASYYGTGAQGFPGFTPVNSGRHSRSDYGGYVDVAVSPVEALKLDGAVRHEQYSDFGSTTIEKLTTRYDFSRAFAIRGTVNNGFRAPTMAEEYYSATNANSTSATAQLPANSAAAKLIGVDNLKPVKTLNYSVGFVTHPLEHLLATLDFYQITEKNRVVGSGTIYAVNASGGPISTAAIQALNVLGENFGDLPQQGVSVFYNGVDTRTDGADLLLTYGSDLGRFGTVDWTATATYNKTEITRIAPNPAELAGIQLLTPQAISALVDASPRYQAVFGALWNVGKFSVNLRETLYGPSFEYAGLNSTTLFKINIDTRATTNLEVAYHLWSNVTLAAGAENLFNVYPNRWPAAYSAYLTAQNNTGIGSAYPVNFSPIGFDGGYYYGRLSIKF
jgi:iron complex outermembrane recepter protein